MWVAFHIVVKVNQPPIAEIEQTSEQKLLLFVRPCVTQGQLLGHFQLALENGDMIVLIRVFLCLQSPFLAFLFQLRIINYSNSLVSHLKNDSEHVSELLGQHFLPHLVPTLSHPFFKLLTFYGIVCAPFLICEKSKLGFKALTEVEFLHAETVLVYVLAKATFFHFSHFNIVAKITVIRFTVNSQAFDEYFVQTGHF